MYETFCLENLAVCFTANETLRSQIKPFYEKKNLKVFCVSSFASSQISNEGHMRSFLVQALSKFRIAVPWVPDSL